MYTIQYMKARGSECATCHGGGISIFICCGQFFRISSSYLKAGLETGAKAEADAKQAAMQKTVFMVLDKDRSIVRQQRRPVVSSPGLRILHREDVTSWTIVAEYDLTSTCSNFCLFVWISS